ncbi:MAG: hypothetical protein ABSH16_09790 [Sedimentisphaerales bacterium]
MVASDSNSKEEKIKNLPFLDKHHFSLKGKQAEDILGFLAHKTFLTDWCYRNPILPDGKELCDLLVIFDDIAVIWQIKDVKLKDGNIKKTDFEKTINQLSGAYRQLFELKTPITLQNPRRGEEIFNPNTIKNIYLIAAFFGDSPFIIKSMIPIKGRRVHVFTRHFTEIILNELDTVFDFTKYLCDKEELHNTVNSIIVDGGEEEILGHYILNNKTFRVPEGSKPFIVYVEDGQWSDLVNRKEYKAKQKENKISYLWDHLIDICHTGDSLEYELIARLMARSNRFERRILADAFFGAHCVADQGQDGLSYRRTMMTNGITYCFLFCGNSKNESERELRKKQLVVMCFIARGQIQENTKVIGIATDQHINPHIEFDYCFIDKPQWTKDDNVVMEQNMKDTGIFTKLDKRYKRFTEFPGGN